ncbi:MAG TPA: ABC transporter permease, partial [Fontimonas sp.]
AVLELPVSGAAHAPNLVAYFKQQGVVIQAAPTDLAGSIRAREHDVILLIEADYAERWRRGESAPVALYYDASRQHAALTVNRVQGLLQAYGSTVAALRLQARGIAPVIVSPLALVDRDVSTDQSRTATLMAMLPYFLILAAFVGGMYLAIDTTSGERERQSLEPLLITPVSRAQIVIGKILATAAYAAVSLLICVLAFVVSIALIPAELIGSALSLPLTMAAKMLLLVLPIAFLAAAAQTVVAALAKTFREAQTYLQFLILIPAIPSMVLVLNPLKPELWMYWTPLFGQSALISDLARGEVVSIVAVAGNVVATLALAGVFAALAIRQYSSESLAVGSAE